jgi:hypothetical protein
VIGLVLTQVLMKKCLNKYVPRGEEAVETKLQQLHNWDVIMLVPA